MSLLGYDVYEIKDLTKAELLDMIGFTEDDYIVKTPGKPLLMKRDILKEIEWKPPTGPSMISGRFWDDVASDLRTTYSSQRSAQPFTEST